MHKPCAVIRDRITLTGTRLGSAFQRLRMCATTQHSYSYREGAAFVQLDFGVLFLLIIGTAIDSIQY